MVKYIFAGCFLFGQFASANLNTTIQCARADGKMLFFSHATDDAPAAATWTINGQPADSNNVYFIETTKVILATRKYPRWMSEDYTIVAKVIPNLTPGMPVSIESYFLICTKMVSDL